MDDKCTTIKLLASEGAYVEYRALQMCCSVSYHKIDCDTCSVCGGDHVMIERRLKCTSETCLATGACPVRWKARHCSSSDAWEVKVNDAAHRRKTLPCLAEHLPIVTKEMKGFIAQQDDADATARHIEARIQDHSGLSAPGRGWPSYKQIQNALKRVREKNGKRNAIEAIEEFVAQWVYTADSESVPDKAFIFGPTLDLSGRPYVASGYANDPFILGLTSPRLIDNVVQHTRGGHFTMFHTDATFKLSDFAYPVITRGFTDSSRSYQLAALFVVSQRTRRDYRMCFQALADVCVRLRGETLRVDAVMGDADQAQLQGIQDVPAFSRAIPLMCFFHVLYNIRKRTRHHSPALRKLIMTSLMDMHFTGSIQEFCIVRDRELERWYRVPELHAFSEYFIKQWLSSEFWRWQVFHSPSGYATTNNPCEVFNASIKSYTQRRRFHMTKMLGKLCDIVKFHTTSRPVPQAFTPKPTSDVVSAAISMVSSGRVSLQQVVGQTSVRVQYIQAPTEADPCSDDVAFATAFDHQAELPVKIANSTDEGKRRDAKKKKAAEMYKRASTWSLWRAHTVDMPANGWVVDYASSHCSCRYFFKFKICAHVVIAQHRENLHSLGKTRKILDRSRKRALPVSFDADPTRDPPVGAIGNPMSRSQVGGGFGMERRDLWVPAGGAVSGFGASQNNYFALGQLQESNWAAAAFLQDTPLVHRHGTSPSAHRWAMPIGNNWHTASAAPERYAEQVCRSPDVAQSSVDVRHQQMEANGQHGSYTWQQHLWQDLGDDLGEVPVPISAALLQDTRRGRQPLAAGALTVEYIMN